MDITRLHDWDLSPTRAIALQRELASRVDLTPPLGPLARVAGADISYNLYSPTVYASVVVLSWPDGALLEARDVVRDVAFPYVPGLLSFRELPPLLEAFAQLETVPDLVVADGQGVAHPRRLGVAAHLGLWLGIPCVGCGKSRLCGTFAEPPAERGGRSPLMDGDERIGTVLRTRAKVSPLYVSPGHLIDHEGAVEAVLRLAPKYRQPETTRRAHDRVNDLRRRAGAAGGEDSPPDAAPENADSVNPPDAGDR